MKLNPPVKRSKPLIPLSHDHHHGLVVCRRILENIKPNSDPGCMATYIRNFWDSDLERHFKEEETIVFPLIPDDDAMVQQALSEHRALSEIVGQLIAEPNGTAPLITEFALLLRAHIRFEERELFPHIEQLASDEDLLTASLKLQGSTKSI